MKAKLKFDKTLALTVFGLLLFGLVMITSIGVPKSIELSAPNVLYPNCSDAAVDCYLLFKKHLFRLLVGLGAFFIAWKLPIRFWKKIAPFLFFGIVALLIIVLLPSGSSYGTIATSWLVVFNTSLQPSEFAKIAIVLYLAYWFSKRQGLVHSFQEGFVPFCVISSLVIIPTLLQNDYGSMLVLAVICASICFVAGAKLRHIGIGALVAFLFATIAIFSVDHVRERFQSFSASGEECTEDECWQTMQANIAIGSGGFFGKGLTQGIQKSYWLPQAADDFIFAASAEELGFLRIIFVVLAYLIIAYRGFTIANGAASYFEKLVAIGLTTAISLQAFINISVNTGLFPVTGITLPFVSYGGSSLIASLIAVGILLNISEKNTHAPSVYRRRIWGARRPQLSRYRRS